MKTLAVALSLIPGLGHLVLKQWRKAAALLVMTGATAAAMLTASWFIIKLVTVTIYIILVLNAMMECYCLASGREGMKESRAYTCFLLLTSGFSALPLLWQSAAFSRRAKIAWTIAVPSLAVVFFSMLFFFGGRIEALLSGAKRAGQ